MSMMKQQDPYVKCGFIINAAKVHGYIQLGIPKAGISYSHDDKVTEYFVLYCIFFNPITVLHSINHYIVHTSRTKILIIFIKFPCSL